MGWLQTLIIVLFLITNAMLQAATLYELAALHRRLETFLNRGE